MGSILNRFRQQQQPQGAPTFSIGQGTVVPQNSRFGQYMQQHQPGSITGAGIGGINPQSGGFSGSIFDRLRSGGGFGGSNNAMSILSQLFGNGNFPGQGQRPQPPGPGQLGHNPRAAEFRRQETQRRAQERANLGGGIFGGIGTRQPFGGSPGVVEYNGPAMDTGPALGSNLPGFNPTPVSPVQGGFQGGNFGSGLIQKQQPDEGPIGSAFRRRRAF